MSRLRIAKVNEFPEGLLKERWPETSKTEADEDYVKRIIDDVKDSGDSALLKFTKEFDKAILDPSMIPVDESEVDEAYAYVTREQVNALKESITRLKLLSQSILERARARARVGTGSRPPQFLRATATFLRSPRRFARLMGLPLNRVANSSSVSSISSISAGPSVPGPARYPGSPEVSANFTFEGHTSWTVYPLPSYVIPLNTGRFHQSRSAG